MDNIVLPLDRVWVRHLELIQPVFLLIHVLDEAATSVCHLTEPVGESTLDHVAACVSLLTIRVRVRHVPHIVRYKLLQSRALTVVNLILLHRVKSLGES